jgi:hypothetical protein
VGRGMADPIESVVELAALIEALFEGDPPLVDRAALCDVHAAPEQRFWLLQDIQALLEQDALNHPPLILGACRAGMLSLARSAGSALMWLGRRRS